MRPTSTRKIVIAAFILFVLGLSWLGGQSVNRYGQLLFTTTTPSGSCTQDQAWILMPGGSLYTCQSGAPGNAAAAASFTQTGTGAVLRTVSGKLNEMISVKDYNAAGDGSTNDTAAIAAAFAANLNGTIVFPAGVYVVHNPSGPLTISGFNGTVLMAGASISCDTSTQGCLNFGSGTAAKFLNLTIGYASQPSVRQNGPALSIHDSTDPLVSGLIVTGSPSSGLIMTNDIRPVLEYSTISNTMADGADFFNSQDARVSNHTAISTGDDGLAFVNYSSGNDYNGAVATNIYVYNGKARGISAVGTSDVAVSNFRIDGTAASGVFCAQDNSAGTRIPSNVKFSNGIIKNAGSVTPMASNHFGAEWSLPSNGGSCEFDNLRIVGATNTTRAFSGIGGANITINKGFVDGQGLVGAGVNATSATLVVSNTVVQNTTSYGYFLSNNTRLIATSNTAINVSQTDSLHRAFWFAGNTAFLANGVTVMDDQVTPTGYVVGESGSTGNGTIQGLVMEAVNGTPSVSITNPSVVKLGQYMLNGVVH